MKVYYESSLWYEQRKYSGRQRSKYSKKQGDKYGRKQKINWKFNYLGQKCYIPYVYRFSKGIVFDIITPVDDAALRNYFEKCKGVDMTDDIQRRSLEDEHPYQPVHIAEVWINGEKVEKGFRATSELYSPLHYNDGMYQVFKKAYREILKDEIHFGVSRFCVPYPKVATRFQKFKRAKRGDVILSLKLKTQEVQKYYPLEKSFELSPMQPTYKLEIEHPVNKEKYVLSFEREEQESWLVKGRQLHVTSANYQIKPPLKEGERLDFNSSISYKSEPKSLYEPASASSIAIIGGAHGPTVLFISGKEERRSCFSKITFESQEVAAFELQGMYIKDMPRQTYEYEKRRRIREKVMV